MVAIRRGEIPPANVEAPARRKSCGLQSPNSQQRDSHSTDATLKKMPPAVADVVKGTRLCKFHVVGTCKRGAQCSFAHGMVELRQVPDLKQTRLCLRFRFAGKCYKGAECRFAHGAHELRQMPLQRQPELFERQDVCPSTKSLVPAMPTLEAYLRAGMLADGNSADDAGSNSRDDTGCGVASMNFKNSDQHQHRQQPQHHNEQQWQQDWEKERLPASPAHKEDNPADSRLKGTPSIDALQNLEEKVETEKSKESQGQLPSQTCCSSETPFGMVKNTFIHFTALHGPSNRSKSVPAAMKLGGAGS